MNKFDNPTKFFPYKDQQLAWKSYSHWKEYIQWFSEANTESKRSRRMEKAVQWLSEGKSRNWK